MSFLRAIRGFYATGLSRPCEDCKDWHEQIYGELLGRFEKIGAENGRLVAEVASLKEAASQKDAYSKAYEALSAAEVTIREKLIKVGTLSKKIDSLCTGHAKKDQIVSTLREKLDTVETKIERFKEIARCSKSQYESKKAEVRALAIGMNDLQRSQYTAVTERSKAIEDKTHALRMRERAESESKEALRERDQQRNELYDAQRIIEELRTENLRLQSAADAAQKVTSGLATSEIASSKILGNTTTSDDEANSGRANPRSLPTPPLSSNPKATRSPSTDITISDKAYEAQNKIFEAHEGQDSMSNTNVRAIIGHQKQQAHWKCPVCNHSCGKAAIHRHDSDGNTIPPQSSSHTSSKMSPDQANASPTPKSRKGEKPRRKVGGCEKTTKAKNASPPSVLPTLVVTDNNISLELPSAKVSAVRRKKPSIQVPNNHTRPRPSLTSPMEVSSSDQMVQMKQKATPSAATSCTDADVLHLKALLDRLTLQGETGDETSSAPAPSIKPLLSLIRPSSTIIVDGKCGTSTFATVTSSLRETAEELSSISTTSAVTERMRLLHSSPRPSTAAPNVEILAPKHETTFQGLQISEEESIASMSSYPSVVVHADLSEILERPAAEASSLRRDNAGVTHLVPSPQVLGLEGSKMETTPQPATIMDPNFSTAPGVAVTSQSASNHNLDDDANDRMDTRDIHRVLGDSVIETKQTKGLQDHLGDQDDDGSTNRMDTSDVNKAPGDPVIDNKQSESTEDHSLDTADDDLIDRMDTSGYHKVQEHSEEKTSQTVGTEGTSLCEGSDDLSDQMDTTGINQPPKVVPANGHMASFAEVTNPSSSNSLQPLIFGGGGDMDEMDDVTATSSRSDLVVEEAGATDAMEEDPPASDKFTLETGESAGDAMEGVQDKPESSHFASRTSGPTGDAMEGVEGRPQAKSSTLKTGKSMEDAMEEVEDRPLANNSTLRTGESVEDIMEEVEDKPMSIESSQIPQQPPDLANTPPVGPCVNGLDVPFPRTNVHEAYTVVTGNSVGMSLPAAAAATATLPVSQRLLPSFGQQPNSAQNATSTSQVSPEMRRFLDQHAPLEQALKFAEGHNHSLTSSTGPRLYDSLNQNTNLLAQPSIAPAPIPAPAAAVTSIAGPPLYDPLNRTPNVLANPSIALAITPAPAAAVTSAPRLNPYSLAALQSPISITPTSIPLSARTSFPHIKPSSVHIPGRIGSSPQAPTSIARLAMDFSSHTSSKVPNSAVEFLVGGHDIVEHRLGKLDSLEPRGGNNTPEGVKLRQKRNPSSLKSRAEDGKVSVTCVPSPSHSAPTPTPTASTNNTPATIETSVEVLTPTASASSTTKSPSSAVTETSSMQSDPTEQPQQRSARQLSK